MSTPWDAIAERNRYLQMLRENRDKSVGLNQQLKQYYKDKLPPIKCVADEIWLYCRYLFDNIEELRKASNTNYRWPSPKIIEPLTEEEKSKFYDKLEELYHAIRGETFYIGKKPSAIAAGLFYLACVVAGLNVNQTSIMACVAISQQGIIKSYRLLKKHLNL